MIDVPIVDSHVHLCDPRRLAYAWTREVPVLNRVVRPSDLTAAASPISIDRFVFVEVDVNEGLHLDEAKWVSEQAAVDPRLQGMVAALPVERGNAIEADLDRLRAYPILCGIRRLIQNQPDPDFCIKQDFIAGLKLLGRSGLPFDICVFHHHLPNVIEMVRQCPEVRFVLDHIGKPAIKANVMDPWRQDLKELATLPNVHCKISGVSTEADHKNWTRAQIRPYIDHAIETFGFDRIMYGGDWHVLELAGTYPDWVAIVDEASRGASATDRKKLFRDNAIAFYGLDR